MRAPRHCTPTIHPDHQPHSGDFSAVYKCCVLFSQRNESPIKKNIHVHVRESYRLYFMTAVILCWWCVKKEQEEMTLDYFVKTSQLHVVQNMFMSPCYSMDCIYMLWLLTCRPDRQWMRRQPPAQRWRRAPPLQRETAWTLQGTGNHSERGQTQAER